MHCFHLQHTATDEIFNMFCRTFRQNIDIYTKESYDEDMANLIDQIKKAGLGEKAAKVYFAALELGEATVQELSQKAGLKRTTVYYTINELVDFGALFETKRNKKRYYIAESPRGVLRLAKDNVTEFENAIEGLETMREGAYPRPRVYFLHGVTGFKKAWDMIFSAKEREFRIMTEGLNFLDYVKEKYILDEIITKKKKIGVISRQIIVDSSYARSIIKKDAQENRLSKLLPSRIKLPFTEIICREFVVFISPAFEKMCMVVENGSFAKTRTALFEILWELLPEKLL